MAAPDEKLTGVPRVVGSAAAVAVWVHCCVVDAPGAVVGIRSITLQAARVTVAHIVRTGMTTIARVAGNAPGGVPAAVFHGVATMACQWPCTPAVALTQSVTLPVVLTATMPTPVLLAGAMPHHV